MNIKKIFINLLFILFLGVIVFSVVTVVKRNNEPKVDYEIPDSTQSVSVDDVLEDTESIDETESTETTETTVIIPRLGFHQSAP